MEFIENHFVGCSILFVITLSILCFTIIAVCEAFARAFKSYLDHKRFLETFLVTQNKEDKQKLLRSIRHPEIKAGDPITAKHFNHIIEEPLHEEKTN